MSGKTGVMLELNCKTKKMKEVKKNEVLKGLDKVLGTKGVKKAGPPMTDALYDKLKDNSVA